MSNGWTLIEVTNSSCDECGNPAACNVYRKPHGCNCLSCREIRLTKVYEYFHVCGYCTDKWLKENKHYSEID